MDDKNCVVLSKDGFNDEIHFASRKGYDLGSEETAKKILNKLDDVQENLSKKIKQLKEPFNYVSMSSKEKEGYKNGILAAKSIVASFKSQLAKQFNVKLKED